MRCEVLLFAQLRETLGRSAMTIELPDGATAGDALEALGAAYEPIARSRASLAVALDGAYASLASPLRDGCTIALIPPVSGG
jgi:MoaE-MoaD fusion protein